MARKYDVAIIGAGAAGMMAAFTAGRRGRSVVVLDHAKAPGEKIRISGGGRCNFTNIHAAPKNYISQNPHFAKSALARYTPADFIAMVDRHKIAWHEKTLGQLFCDDSAKDIIRMLLEEMRAVHVDLKLSCEISDVENGPDGFRLSTSEGPIHATSLVMASGGKSIPKMGATGFALDTARRFGLRVVPTRPALVPLTFADAALDLMRPLSGLALEAVAQAGGPPFREAMLFTHRGLSGPAVLQASSYWREGEAITLDLLPDRDAAALLLAGKRARPKAEPRTVLAELLPQRLAQAMAAIHLPPRVIGEVGDAELRKLGALLKAWRLTPSGTEGYAKAEVMAGGVDTDDLSSRTMEAKAVPGLFVVGEAVDVTGWLGGYNFQWAWSSGWAAGEAV